MNDDAKQRILAELEPMFANARAKGLWFYSAYADAWFSPDELAATHKTGKFIWSPENWELRDPQEFIDEERREIANIEQALRDFEARMRKWKGKAK